MTRRGEKERERTIGNEKERERTRGNDPSPSQMECGDGAWRISHSRQADLAFPSGATQKRSENAAETQRPSLPSHHSVIPEPSFRHSPGGTRSVIKRRSAWEFAIAFRLAGRRGIAFRFSLIRGGIPPVVQSSSHPFVPPSSPPASSGIPRHPPSPSHPS